LPRHRGRSAIEWAMNEPITDGTVFWLNAGIDRGDITLGLVWEELCPMMGVKLFEMALKDILKGTIIRKPQDKRFSTFEPDTNVKGIFKPDLLMIEYDKKSRL